MRYVPPLVAFLVVVSVTVAPATASSSGVEKTCSEQEESLLKQVADYLGFVPSFGTTMKCVSAGAMWVGCLTVGTTTIVAAFNPFPDEVVTFPASAMACSAASAQSMMCTASYAKDAGQNAAEEAIDDASDSAENSCTS